MKLALKSIFLNTQKITIVIEFIYFFNYLFSIYYFRFKQFTEIHNLNKIPLYFIDKYKKKKAFIYF